MNGKRGKTGAERESKDDEDSERMKIRNDNKKSL